MKNEVHYAALVELVESNWTEFVELCEGDEGDAENTLELLKKEAHFDS